MAISTFAELRTAVAGWLNRTDLTATIPDFVLLAEADIRNDVRVRAMEQLTSGTLTGETLSAPERFLDARRFIVSGAKREYRTPEQYADIGRAGASLSVFTHIGQSLYVLNGNDGDDYTLLYNQSFAALDSDDDTNWLLTNAPDVYLWGACKYGAMWLKDKEQEMTFEGRYSAAVARVNAREAVAKSSGSALSQFPTAAA